MKNKCGTCHLCCEVFMLNVSDVPDDGREFFETWGCVIGDNCSGGTVLKLHHPCQYLTKEGCSIYKKRPKFCREYKCESILT
jgi:Fe-S-cluster containining protein